MLSSYRSPRSWISLLTPLLGAQVALGSIDLNLDDENSIKKAASHIAHGMVSYYTGNHTGDVPGNLPDPYYWWEAGAMFGALIDYWWYTGDDAYNKITMQAMLHQVGTEKNYEPRNQSRSLGNDDQAFWAISAMSAVENKFPDPPPDQPQWLYLVQAVFNRQSARWDNETCGGGLRWQIFSLNNGYHYKNAISNGAFFHLAARLARYTNDESYSKWADKAWRWMTAIKLISPTFQIFDGTDSADNCSGINHIQWSYNNGILLLGTAHMYNHTNKDPVWKDRLFGLIKGFEVFFSQKEPKGVMIEVACEAQGNCNNDQRSFKAYMARWMAATMIIAPDTIEKINPLLRESAKAAALQCNGPDNACGLYWTKGADWGTSKTGVGEQMAALEVIQSNLWYKKQASGPANSKTGTSKGDPNAGNDSGNNQTKQPSEINSGDRAGAGILTTLILLGIAGGVWWMVS
ncbi:TPA_exp: putative Glycosyl hydrolase [Trichophyton benhamiae CBS 112371]|uniref:Mannan endo-1,6-alpha-mannosidase n=1 Tax=Arthroderma benhamiae (strain ATCC MYA-4681 / CBS 112371) TaxID=663331 RepID=D4ATT7_ARTBC|nr:glycosyl hydrolase, putative [Trichophyton benhamiae CBS 112371]EFE33706.1 glycosyl hydrolase, putative [Trichophyton benhamiae CBS 112371]DAA76716.1 TPA_exp: putative Glycosyl hydrolase [Trichophyton benhamiae CBS 112371]